MNTATTFVDLAFTWLAIFREEIQVKHSWSPEGNFPSVKWLKPSPAEQLPAFSQHPPTDTPAPSSPCSTGISHNLSAGRCSFQNSDEGAVTTALFWDIIWN